MTGGRPTAGPIVLTAWWLDVQGGAQRQALRLAQEWRRRGNPPSVRAVAVDRSRCYPALWEGLDAQGVYAGADPAQARLARWARWGLAGKAAGRAATYSLRLRDAARLAALIPSDAPAVNIHDYFGPEVAQALRSRGYRGRIVWMMNDAPLIVQYLDKLREGETGRPWFRPALRLAAQAWAAGALARERTRLRAVDVVAVLSDQVRDQVRRVLDRDAVVVRSGVPEPSPHAGAPRRSQSSLRMLVVGVLFRYRRFEDAIVALARLRRDGRDARLTIVGNPQFDPDYARSLSALAASERVDEAVTFLPGADDARLKALYAEADVFVFPSRQSWGLAVFEALAAGCPVIVSEAAGASELIRTGGGGVVVRHRDPDAIAAAAARLADEPGLRARSVEEGRALAAQYSWGRYADEMSRLCGVAA